MSEAPFEFAMKPLPHFIFIMVSLLGLILH